VPAKDGPRVLVKGGCALASPDSFSAWRVKPAWGPQVPPKLRSGDSRD
jgi:hypothetical protein